MLDNTILGHSAIEVEGTSTTRLDPAAQSELYIGSREETYAGDDVLACVVKETTPEDVTLEGASAFTKSSSSVQIKWTKPDPLKILDAAVDYDAANATALLEQINYLFGLTIDVPTAVAVTTSPFFRISARES